MSCQQYDLFHKRGNERDSEIENILHEIEEIKACLHKVRKGTYASIGEIKKVSLNYDDRLNVIERNICKGDDQ